MFEFYRWKCFAARSTERIYSLLMVQTICKSNTPESGKVRSRNIAVINVGSQAGIVTIWMSRIRERQVGFLKE